MIHATHLVGSPSLADGVLPLRILLAEDDQEFRELLASTLRADGYLVTECANGLSLLDHFARMLPARRKTFDLIISDVRMPGVSGLEVLRDTQHMVERPAWILMTAFGDEDVHEAAKDLRVVAFFDKPFDIDELRAKVRGLARGKG